MKKLELAKQLDCDIDAVTIATPQEFWEEILFDYSEFANNLTLQELKKSIGDLKTAMQNNAKLVNAVLEYFGGSWNLSDWIDAKYVAWENAGEYWGKELIIVDGLEK